MKNDSMDHAYAKINLSDIFSEDYITVSEKEDIPSLSLSGLDTITLDSLSDTYYANPITNVSIAGSGTSIYQGLTSQTITLSPSPYSNISSWPSINDTLTVNHGNNNGIKVKGDTEIEGSLKVKGVDLGEMLSKIQDQLAIYQPAPELEEKWEKLRDLARQYKEMVADIKEKEKIWDILQK
jgi:hypothetical protein